MLALVTLNARSNLAEIPATLSTTSAPSGEGAAIEVEMGGTAELRPGASVNPESESGSSNVVRRCSL